MCSSLKHLVSFLLHPIWWFHCSDISLHFPILVFIILSLHYLQLMDNGLLEYQLLLPHFLPLMSDLWVKFNLTCSDGPVVCPNYSKLVGEELGQMVGWMGGEISIYLMPPPRLATHLMCCVLYGSYVYLYEWVCTETFIPQRGFDESLVHMFVWLFCWTMGFQAHVHMAPKWWKC